MLVEPLDERAARCALCSASIFVPNQPGDTWVCGDCVETHGTEECDRLINTEEKEKI